MGKPITTDQVAGIRHERLEVMCTLPRQPGEPLYVLCACDCGETKAIRWDGFQSKKVKSCGCMIRDRNRANNAEHAARKNKRLARMKGRCHEHTAREWAVLLGCGESAVKKYARLLREPLSHSREGHVLYETDDPGRHPEMGRLWDAVGARVWWDREGEA